MKTTERQFEEVRKELHYSKINLATEKQMVTELREELRKVRETAQLFKEVAEVKKQATYALGVQETQSRFIEEFSAVARDYCDISWGKTLDATRIPADSSLKRPESIYYNPDICELSGPSSSPSAQLAQVFEVPTADQAPPAPVETSIDPHPDAGKRKELKLPRAKIRAKARTRVKTGPQTPLSLSPSKLLIQGLPSHKRRILVL